MSNISFLNIVKNYRRLLSEDGNRKVNKFLSLSVLAGVADAFALWCVLAGVSALVTGNGAFGLSLTSWILVVVVIAISGFVFTYVIAKLSYLCSLDVMRNCHQVVGDKIASLPLGWFSGTDSSKYSRSLTTGMMSMGEILAHMLGTTVSKIVQLTTLTVIMWFWNWNLALVLSIALPFYFFIVWVLGALANRISTWHEVSKNTLSARLVEYSATQKALRSAGRASHPPHLGEAVARENKVAHKALWGETALMSISGSIAQAVSVILIFVAVNLAISGQIQPLVAIAFVGICLRLYSVITAIAEGILGIQLLRNFMGPIDEVLKAQTMPEPEVSKELPHNADIEFENVDFSYHQGQPVLRNVSFKVPANSMTALVGPSGSGKTTIARLVSRFYDVDGGIVRVGGVDVRDLQISDLMERISMVFQDVYLYNDTLLANIKVGSPSASHEQLMAAADLAGVSEIVERLPHGWDTAVGEGGSKLSGGERQRVSIARALVKRAPIVLIDEATSALDAENEARISASVEDLRSSSTVIVIAHKLNTIEHADQIVVLNADGSIAQIGRHCDLVRVKGIYQDFIRQRELAEGWSLTRA